METFAVARLFVSVALLYLPLPLAAQSELRGKVVDARTGEPLEGVCIDVVEGPTVFTGALGAFRIAPLPSAAIRLRISAPGYGLLKYDVPAGAAAVREGLDLSLQPDADMVRSTITVAEGPFEGAAGAAAPSEHTLNKAELQALGTSLLGDPLRSVQALPSVTTTNDNRGEVSVRGSDFDRVALMVDGVFLDGFLHQITSDGLGADRDRASFSIVTPDRISEVSLLNSAFPASYGIRTAGILVLDTRDGNREKPNYRIATGLMLGTSLVHDSPFAGKRGSYLVGLRSSTLNPSNVSTPDRQARFTDGQVKLLYDLTARHRVGFNALLGEFFYNDKKLPLTEGRNTTTQANSKSMALMANWDWTISSRAYAATKVFHTQTGLNALNRESLLIARLPRRQWGGRQDWTLDTGRGGRVQFGTYLRSVETEANVYAFLGAAQQMRLSVEGFRGSTMEGSYYAQTTQDLGSGLLVSGGLRVETNTVTRERFVSPRVSLAWNPGEGRVSLRAGFGRHRQFPDLLSVLGLGGNRDLRAERTDHYTAGADVRLGERARLRLELFERRDNDQVFAIGEPRLLGGRVVDLSARPANSLSGYARGFEAMLQRRSGNRFSGWISYAYLRTRMTDSVSGLSAPTDFDQRHTASLFGAYRLARSWSLNANYRAASGSPLAAFLRRETDGGYFLAGERNALRLPAYGRLDVRLSKSWNWGPTRWNLMVECLNVLNQGNQSFNGISRYDNVTGRVLNPVTFYGFTRTPSAGLVIQF
jgi:hypothetical protein